MMTEARQKKMEDSESDEEFVDACETFEHGLAAISNPDLLKKDVDKSPVKKDIDIASNEQYKAGCTTRTSDMHVPNENTSNSVEQTHNDAPNNDKDEIEVKTNDSQISDDKNRPSDNTKENHSSDEDNDGDNEVYDEDDEEDATESDCEKLLHEALNEDIQTNPNKPDEDKEEEVQIDKYLIDEDNLKVMEVNMSDDEKQERQKEAQQLKKTGNEKFRDGLQVDAANFYTQALQICPLCFAKDRAIMYSNRAACRMKLDDDKGAIEDCSKAVELNSVYLKAILRRAELYEKTDKLDEALGDYQRLLELDPTMHVARSACMRLPDQIKERNEKLKAEMMGKLKDLGNMVLKPFGLSTNNFNLVQDPNTGGYSVNFNNNGK
ncbi:unnamed protein product [Owenia fusiformis]|uniref:Tetratricopeptide repeat protein 1 n=1 Tax=Owenia fusiformis TaxID=6347 RepID=A0A8S4NPE8_OWEFU|nr:unnamed protein product [Owenia fusiformis]